MTGIPTKYRGRRYRSRLEARWAAFFDLLDWRYEYEPVDLEGWIPDFAILGAEVIYVEVKPIYEFDPVIGARIGGKTEAEVLLLGATIPSLGMTRNPWLSGNESRYFGWLKDILWSPDGEWWGDAILGIWGGEAKRNPECRFGFCHADGSWHDRITGLHNDGFFGRVDFDPALIQSFWSYAANEVQWRPDK